MFRLDLERLNPDFCYNERFEPVGREAFLKLVSGARLFLKAQPKRIVLSFQDSYQFAVGLIAALAENKTIIILPNTKMGTIESFNSEFDLVLNETLFSQIEPTEIIDNLTFSKDAAIVFFTSGSQGRPKKVGKRFENLYEEVLVLEKTFGLKLAQSTFAATVSHQHIYGFLFKLLWPILTGKCFLAPVVEYPEQVQRVSQKLKSFTLISSPAFLKRYFLPNYTVSNAKTIFSSGGTLNFATAMQIQKTIGICPIEVYGSTESGGIAYRQLDQPDKIWTQFSGVEISAINQDQLAVKSRYFDEEKVVMNDRVQIGANGFQLLERLDDIVKVEEKRISLVEVNQRMQSSGLVQDSVVFDIELKGRQQLATLIVLNTDGTKLMREKGIPFLTAEIKRYLKNHFDEVLIPRKFRYLEKLPYNEQSKLLKSELRGFFHGR